ncbi:MAG TPA: phosphatase PAP2 family protein [Methylophilaceae bacterium]|nr:phosphatase PAP2 family protein [Methylophilaceae bacterium]
MLLNPIFSLFVSALMLICLNQFTNIDLLLADYYFDFQTNHFIWKNSWFAQQLMHIYIKNAIMFLGFALISFVLIDIVISFKWVTNWLRIRLRFAAISALVVPSIISVLKRHSVLHCPWDEQRYGGAAPYLRLLDSIPSAMEAGHCFPAGHASTGLWLAAFCVFWLPNRPRVAICVFFAGLCVGFVLGWVQQMRGAHFLSHTLWSMWIAGATVIVMIRVSESFLYSNQQ